MKKLFILSLFITFTVTLFAQRYVTSGKVHTFIQTSTKEGVAINGSSTDMQIEYPPNQEIMRLQLDPLTLTTDNIEFNEQLQNSLLGPFEFVIEVDASRFDYQSKYNEKMELDAEVSINNITSNIIVTLVVTNKKTINTNNYAIAGSGVVVVDDHELREVFPNIGDEIIFKFTQNLSAKLR